jgi:hypothetical protein
MPQININVRAVFGLFWLIFGTACATTQPTDNDWRAQLAQMAPPTHMEVGICAPAPEPISTRPATPLTWAHPLPQGDNLLGIWGANPSNIWAVGDTGRILHFDGSVWRQLDTASDDYLAGVWTDTSGETFITGYNGRVLHYHNGRWRNHPTGVSNDFNGIWGSGPDDVFTVADRGIIFHWDGQCWKRQDSGTDNLFFGVWGSGPTDVWAVGGRSNVAHYDGQNWSAVDTGVQAHYVSVWGSGPDNLYIAGNDGILLHRTGGTWQREELNTRALLRWIWGSGPNDVWVAGDEGIVRHFDGSAWRTVSSGTTQAIRGAWQTANGTSYLVGDDGLLLKGAPTGLAPVRKGPFADLAAVSGNWAAGTGSTLMYRSNDGKWYPKNLNATSTVAAVTELSDGRVLAAAGNTLWLGNAQGWHLQDNPQASPVRAIRSWGKFAIAVNDQGQLLRFDGQIWHALAGPMDTLTEPAETLREGTANGPGAPALFGLGGNGPDDFWLVGPAGRAFHYQNGTWHHRPLPDGDQSEDLTAVTGSGLAVGMAGNIYRWRGNGWKKLTPKGGGLALYAIAENADGKAWAVGDFGTILSIDGKRIENFSNVTGQSLWGADIAADGRVTLVGDGGTILEVPAPATGAKIK